ncbi:hypothetical protein FB45DRAFT_5280 [Roridomyces roridus]|uniref:Uncharacterized protein n=1 Tax=Roridomyces roridus TaxID=1738132 RepID=A0AAD7CIL0_9AGAR|nr:hypothetical protein FB45DRAFT_5280 [Roridomyces roridus]
MSTQEFEASDLKRTLPKSPECAVLAFLDRSSIPPLRALELQDFTRWVDLAAILPGLTCLRIASESTSVVEQLLTFLARSGTATYLLRALIARRAQLRTVRVITGKPHHYIESIEVLALAQLKELLADGTDIYFGDGKSEEKLHSSYLPS